MPAFEPNPIRVSTNTSPAVVGDSVGRRHATPANESSSACAVEHQQPDQDGHEPQVGHHRVPARRPMATSGAAAVLGEHQQQRGQRHQLPAHQERAHTRRRRHQQHRRHEQRQRRLHPAPVQAVAGGIADPVDADRDRDRAGDGQEHPAQRCPRSSTTPASGSSPGSAADQRLTGQRGHPGSHPGRAAQRCARRRPRPIAPAAGPAAPLSRWRRPQPARPAMARGDHVHRPVRVRSASTIASGLGGQPGTSRSTGTTSATAPATPYAPANTPQLRAQSPTATTTFGAGTAS